MIILLHQLSTHQIESAAYNLHAINDMNTCEWQAISCVMTLPSEWMAQNLNNAFKCSSFICSHCVIQQAVK